jgi:hypothetical protein
MSLNYRQERQLCRIESRLLRSDPQLAAMLAVFGRLAAGQRMPSWEQIATSQGRVRQAGARIAKAITAMTMAIGAVLALITAIVVARRARPPQSARQQTGG